MGRDEAVAGGEIRERIAELAQRVVSDGTAGGFTVAVAESLTGGLLAASLTSVPGASAVFRGSVTAYATDIKASVLGVDAELLARQGAVDPEVARQMAAGVRRLFGATVGLATTGVAGPTEQDGKPVGLVYIGHAGPEDAPTATELRLDGDREAIRLQTVLRTLELVFKNG